MLCRPDHICWCEVWMARSLFGFDRILELDQVGGQAEFKKHSACRGRLEERADQRPDGLLRLSNTHLHQVVMHIGPPRTLCCLAALFKSRFSVLPDLTNDKINQGHMMLSNIAVRVRYSVVGSSHRSKKGIVVDLDFLLGSRSCPRVA